MIGNSLAISGATPLTKVREDGYSSEFRGRTGSERYVLLIRHSTENKVVNGSKMDRHNVSLKRVTIPFIDPVTGTNVPATEAEILITFRHPQEMDATTIKDLAGWLYAMVDADGPISIDQLVNFES